jgi:hypothetical protein
MFSILEITANSNLNDIISTSHSNPVRPLSFTIVLPIPKRFNPVPVLSSYLRPIYGHSTETVFKALACSHTALQPAIDERIQINAQAEYARAVRI